MQKNDSMQKKNIYKISVIIPVYNAENTLKMTINSILNQKWNGDINKDIEIICVDDASTDCSLDIIKDYASKHPNIKYFPYNNNSGFAGRGRNKGIEISNGEYIVFADSDDEYLLDGIKTLYDAIKDDNVDIVISSWKSDASPLDNSIQMCPKKYINTKTYDTKNNQNSFEIIFRNIAIAPWAKIFKKKFLIDNNLNFIEDANFEDVEHTFKCLLTSDKVKLIPKKATYMYYTYEESMVHTHNIREFESYVKILKIISNTLKKKGFSDKRVMNERFGVLYLLFLSIECTKEEKKELFNQLHILHKKFNYVKLFEFPLTLLEKPVLNNDFETTYKKANRLNKIYSNKIFLKTYRVIITLKRKLNKY